MAAFRVIDIERDKPDSAGAIVCDIYSKIEGVYAVYRTAERVMIHFADDQALGSEQRQSLSELYVLRGKINSLLGELRGSSIAGRRFSDSRYVRWMADALVIALQGQVSQAKTDLENLHAALASERSSRIRLSYLLYAAMATGMMIFVIYVINSGIFAFTFDETAKTFWYAACVGMVGAFTSVAFQISKRELDTEKPLFDMVGDAVLRIFVGAITAVILMAFIQTEALSFKVGNIDLITKEKMTLGGGNWPGVLLVAVFAGWTQNLLPELFAKVKVAQDSATQPPPVLAAGRADERNPMGRGPASATLPSLAQGAASDAVITDPEADEADTCDDHCHDDGPVTEDVELPVAVGGVEGRD